MNNHFKVRPTYLLPILASLVFGVFCSFLILTSPLEVYRVTPFPEGYLSLFNALYFVILVGVGATIIYFLLRRRSRKIVNVIVCFALTTAVFLLSMIYLSAAFSKFALAFTHARLLIPIFSFLITIFVDITIFKIQGVISDIIVLFLGGGLGAFLGVSIPTLSTILILLFLAAYDAFAVYQGVVGKIASLGLEQLRGLSFSFREIQIGLGDLTFYSMLCGHMLFNFDLIPCLTSMAGILFGCFLAFKMLERKGIFPGLPLPIIFGLAAGFLPFLFGL
ncbi:MAG: hypothetical protein QW667_05140 [Candidatus Bathyarchaeia archaeon]